MSETAAAPLIRLGTYRIEERTGANPVGPAVTGAALAAVWRDLIAYCVGMRARRASESAAVDAAYAAGDPAGADSAMRLRYTHKIEIKSAEAVAALLHGIIAPDAPFLCDDRCAHVAGGASAEQVKRFLDSIDAIVLDRLASWRECRSGHACYEDLEDEIGIYGRWRRRIVAGG